jgi:transcriptional regulator with XRE-family HTH domain
MQIAVPLEDWRRNAYQTVEEFAMRLGITPSTYYRALKGQIELPTMRRIATGLGVSPAAIAEFTPAPSARLLQQLTDVIDQAEHDGWLEVDPETLQPTGQRVWSTLPRDTP